MFSCKQGNFTTLTCFLLPKEHINDQCDNRIKIAWELRNTFLQTRTLPRDFQVYIHAGFLFWKQNSRDSIVQELFYLKEARSLRLSYFKRTFLATQEFP